MNFIHEHIAICELDLDFKKIFDSLNKIDDKFLPVGHRTQLTMKIDFHAEKIESQEQSYLKDLVKNKVHPLVYDFMEKIGINKNDYSHFPNILASKMIPGTDMGSHFDPEDAVVYLLYLNEGFEGGSLVFDDLNIEFNPSAGKLFIFYSKYKHHVTMLQGIPRYTISSGFSPKEYFLNHEPSS
jgi:hypothetical protein